MAVELRHRKIRGSLAQNLVGPSQLLDLPLQQLEALTVTGGLTFAGGPGNNYVTHALATMLGRLRADPGANGLVTGNGYYLTKHSLTVLGTRAPRHGFQRESPQAEVDGQRLSPEELLGFFQLLLVGGQETTANLINNAVLCLLDHGQQRRDADAAPDEDQSRRGAQPEMVAWAADAEAVPDGDVVVTPRIGITKAAEWPLRYFVAGDPFVSKTPRSFPRTGWPPALRPVSP